MHALCNVVYALRAERALAASAAMWRLTVAPGDDLELDEFQSRESLDSWLFQPSAEDAAAEAAVLAWLT